MSAIRNASISACKRLRIFFRVAKQNPENTRRIASYQFSQANYLWLAFVFSGPKKNRRNANPRFLPHFLARTSTTIFPAGPVHGLWRDHGFLGRPYSFDGRTRPRLALGAVDGAADGRPRRRGLLPD